ncbi:hypothetical protein HanXRQr2_Chr07g0287901 [Helianthus annuus]|uniref:Uncharacterized protein n=1 Tax=Helianthus annuus TaxID=4232 RepID=A0A251T7Z5_HELAN|nr:hypothetical protein HanXRQr2_Chr07g0287901 [Helianthus annuus]KAJ0959245.1 hypothetical protein HanPSC8_Chr00c260g0807001 [Helianthus annuus]
MEVKRLYDVVSGAPVVEIFSLMVQTVVDAQRSVYWLLFLVNLFIGFFVRYLSKFFLGFCLMLDSLSVDFLSTLYFAIISNYITYSCFF